MARHSSPKERSHEPLLRRLEQAAEKMNPFLILLAVGLAVLNFSVYVSFQLPRPPTH
jgi:hypothetical protein